MTVTALFGVAIGLYAVWLAVKAVLEGTVTFVAARLLGGWGPTLGADLDREEHPVAFWATTALYGGGGLLMVGACVRVLLR